MARGAMAKHNEILSSSPGLGLTGTIAFGGHSAEHTSLMKKVSDYQGLIESDADVIRRVLLEWKPSRFDLDEKGQERELFACLKQQLPGVAMKSQYGIAWGTADIVIEDTHVIELKLGFTPQSVGEFDRCVGQLWRYKEKWVEPKQDGRVWLITVGESEAEFQHLLKKLFKELNDHFLSSPCEWLEKRPG